jgi:hypothetical protein
LLPRAIAIAAAALCITAVSATAAQAATFHAEGGEIKGGLFLIEPNESARLELYPSGKGDRIECNAGGGAAIAGPSYIEIHVSVNKCKAVENVTNKIDPNCPIKASESFINLIGDGNSVQLNGGMPPIEFTSEACALGSKPKIVLNPSMSLERSPWANPLEAHAHEVIGADSGTFGNVSMTVIFHKTLESPSKLWGWY